MQSFSFGLAQVQNALAISRAMCTPWIVGAPRQYTPHTQAQTHTDTRAQRLCTDIMKFLL